MLPMLPRSKYLILCSLDKNQRNHAMREAGDVPDNLLALADEVIE